MVECAVKTQGMGILTHGEWFFRHQEHAGEALSHLTLRCSTNHQTTASRVVARNLLHVSQLTESGRLRLLDALLWPARSWASSSLE